MSRQTIDDLMAEFGESIEISDLALDEDGFVCVVTEIGISLNIEHLEEDDSLLMHATVGEIPDEQRFVVYEEMLKANFLWRDTMGATLSVTPDGQHAMLMISVTTGDLDVPKLINVFECATGLAYVWSVRFRQMIGEIDVIDHDENDVDEPANENFNPSMLA